MGIYPVIYNTIFARNRKREEIVSSLLLDCKTVRIFAYSSTREQSNKRFGTRLNTESETGAERKNRMFCSLVYYEFLHIVCRATEGLSSIKY